MVVLNYTGEEINAKIVYYGPGLSGKTTNLEYLYGQMPADSKGQMVSMKTRTDRTLFFDFFPLELGEICGYRTRFLLYTVPGQVYYNATRKLVLKGADAVVFVADSAPDKLQENIESLRNLEDNLNEHGLSLDNIPWVIQYNKRDLPECMQVSELHQHLNLMNVPAFEAIAMTGVGVYDTFKEVAGMLYRQLKERLESGEVIATQGAAGDEVAPVPGGEAGGDVGNSIDSALREVGGVHPGGRGVAAPHQPAQPSQPPAAAPPKAPAPSPIPGPAGANPKQPSPAPSPQPAQPSQPQGQADASPWDILQPNPQPDYGAQSLGAPDATPENASQPRGQSGASPRDASQPRAPSQAKPPSAPQPRAQSDASPRDASQPRAPSQAKPPSAPQPRAQSGASPRDASQPRAQSGASPRDASQPRAQSDASPRDASQPDHLFSFSSEEGETSPDVGRLVELDEPPDNGANEFDSSDFITDPMQRNAPDQSPEIESEEAPVVTERKVEPNEQELVVPVVVSRSQVRKTIPLKLRLEIRVVDD